ncbi:unnamed protein product [Aphanomyces euteiches]|uniref:Uncharacterized protein n=1 Tax=Aphanomyces euteiches TaxID=100861 RepID=A0A6G0XMM9_9STRA|nr:hypothetical protein Ae201684_003384 [Aphanomyces euteiches]KAH9098625.1 hypothetical protein Ae201684P_017836 [Aphanomyces euteiches]KAH9134858.1 hypothetical protein LEN26_006669 [Aphanomyces euteiches]KAH9144068.1 hypothetical protein AeRB84_011964 [Aphanomyces euteiches]
MSTAAGLVSKRESWKDPMDVLDELEASGMLSPLSSLKVQWDDLERLIQATRTPNQTIDELIQSLEAIDFSDMLDAVEPQDDSDAEDDLITCENRSSVVSRSGHSFSEAFTMEDIQTMWGEEFTTNGFVEIPQRERLLVKTILINIVRILLPDIDSTYKAMSKTRLVQVFECANRILSRFLQ